MEEIRFDEVSTENAEKTFVEIILKKSLTDRKESYQTFFLNGVWESGKTTFLNNAERNANRTRFVNLKLWELQDERSVKLSIIDTSIPSTSLKTRAWRMS